MATIAELTNRPIGDVLIRGYPGGRFRFDISVIPEIAAWLLMHGNRAEKMYQSAYTYSKGTSDAYVKGLQRAMECRKDCIQMLINCLTDKWALCDYNDAWNTICHDFQIVYDPQKFDWYGVDHVLTDGGGI
jgi:hypothetical protein